MLWIMYDMTGEESYREAAGKFIRAWNEDKYGWAIIDCMLNISLLFWASEETGDSRYKHIASE
ncbi:MAG TPA: hypothetical protein DEF35_04055 [Paenibacillus sp.]|nr:hypothetical protein CA599_11965 [Paenibacillus taichungensis]HBU80800.1 hypothetical protein [Paenibacillus sp.]